MNEPIYEPVPPFLISKFHGTDGEVLVIFVPVDDNDHRAKTTRRKGAVNYETIVKLAE